MTALNLAANLGLLANDSSSVATTSMFDLGSYQSPSMEPEAHRAERPDEHSIQRVLVDNLVLVAQGSRYSRFVQSDATLIQVELGPVPTSHSGEVAKAKAIQRIGELNESAQEEQIVVNYSSEVDLLKYVSGYTGSDDLNIFLLDGGTFRVIWKTSETRQSGLEFLGKGVLRETRVTRNLETGQYSAASGMKSLEIICGF
jgi:hypothetical protein